MNPNMRIVDLTGVWTLSCPGRDDIAGLEVVVPGGVHPLQMELACRGYMHEPATVDEDNWPMPYDPAHAAPLRDTLQNVLRACLNFVSKRD